MNKLNILQKLQALFKGNCATCGSVKMERGWYGRKECRNLKCTDKNNYYNLYKDL